MKRISLLATLALSSVLVFSCTTVGTTTSDSDTTTETSIPSNLDGIYRGVNDGQKITLYLMSNKTFKLIKETIKEENNTKTESTGSYAVIGKLITLTDSGKIYTYLHTDDTLTQVDASGKKLSTSDLDKYILTKGNYSILNRKWKLVEINGKAVTSEASNNNEPYIQFHDAENRYSAYAGCNRMSGTFTTEGYNKLKTGVGISTMMACTNMELESQLGKVMEQADTFIVKGDELQLVKGRMAPLAKFIAPVN